MIQLSRIEGFYWVARTEGYARAARAFPWPITQPGVHQQVRRLEEDLGVALFERAGKDRVLLTPAGQALYEVVAPFYEQLPQLEARLKGGTVGGTLRIHAAGHVLRHVLPGWLRALQRARPDVEVALTEVKTADLAELRRGDADLLVDWLEAVPADIETKVVATVRAFIVVPTGHPLARRAHLDLAQLSGTPFIGYHSDRTLRQLQEKALRSHHLEPRAAYAADSSDTILGFVAAGLGFSLVPSPQPNGPHVPGVVAFPLERPKAEFNIYAAWKRRKAGNPLVAAALSAAPPR